MNLGHSSILVIQGIPFIDSSKERFNGYKRALKNKGIKIKSQFILSGNFTVDSGHLSVKEYLDN